MSHEEPVDESSFPHDLLCRMFGTYKIKDNDVLKKQMRQWNEFGLILGILSFIDVCMINKLVNQRSI